MYYCDRISIKNIVYYFNLSYGTPYFWYNCSPNEAKAQPRKAYGIKACAIVFR